MASTQLEFIGPYQLNKRFGQNNITGVYEAKHQQTGEQVALRVFYNADQGDIREQFMSRVKDIAELSHPALVPVIDYGVTDSEVYLAMPLLRGGSLKQRLKLNQTVVNHEVVLPLEELPSLGEVSAMLERLSGALDYLHEQDMVHYHVQPSNVLFDSAGNAYLADTGLARIMKVVFSLQVTNAINTNPYAPPEQWNGEVAVAASDQYSLACLVYELVTGRPLFQSSSIFELMNMHQNEFLIPPHHVRPDVPPNLTIVLVRALAKSPEERYETTREFSTAFRGAVARHQGTKTDFFTVDLSRTKQHAWQHLALVVPNEYDLNLHQPIETALKQAGYDFWQDDSVKLGTLAWKNAVRYAVKNTACVILPVAENTMKSDWVTLSLAYAKHYQKPVYAVLMNGQTRHTTQFVAVYDAREDQTGTLEKLCTHLGENFASNSLTTS